MKYIPARATETCATCPFYQWDYQTGDDEPKCYHADSLAENKDGKPLTITEAQQEGEEDPLDTIPEWCPLDEETDEQRIERELEETIKNIRAEYPDCRDYGIIEDSNPVQFHLFDKDDKIIATVGEGYIIDCGG